MKPIRVSKVIHERIPDARNIRIGSDRSFGLVFVTFFSVLGVFDCWGNGRFLSWWYLAALLVLTATLAAPQLLRAIQSRVGQTGVLLGKVTSPVFLFVVFYVAVVPVGLVMRAFGRDVLRLRRKSTVDSYWIDRSPPGPAPEQMRDQF